jgi:hypothetical protein
VLFFQLFVANKPIKSYFWAAWNNLHNLPHFLSYLLWPKFHTNLATDVRRTLPSWYTSPSIPLLERTCDDCRAFNWSKERHSPGFRGRSSSQLNSRSTSDAVADFHRPGNLFRDAYGHNIPWRRRHGKFHLR